MAVDVEWLESLISLNYYLRFIAAYDYYYYLVILFRANSLVTAGLFINYENVCVCRHSYATGFHV